MFAWMKKKRDAQPDSRNVPQLTDMRPANAAPSQKPAIQSASTTPPEKPAITTPPEQSAIDMPSQQPAPPDAGEQPKPYWSSGSSQVDWMEEMYNDQVRKGAFDNLPGKGKPLEIQTGDVFHSILKNANVLPEWLRLQHEIRDHIGKLVAAMPGKTDHAVEQAIGELNVKIKKYNTLVPSTILQKGKLTMTNLERQYELWQ